MPFLRDFACFVVFDRGRATRPAVSCSALGALSRRLRPGGWMIYNCVTESE
jgi:hypothetical protein